jgi:predicted nucleotidyltransferase
MLLEFIVGEKSYKIDLSTNKHNFYVSKNILDKKFFLYYLRYIHPEEIILDEDDLQLDEITIKLIDHNVNIIKLCLTENPNQSIEFDTTGYKIISNL